MADLEQQEVPCAGGTQECETLEVGGLDAGVGLVVGFVRPPERFANVVDSCKGVQLFCCSQNDKHASRTYEDREERVVGRPGYGTVVRIAFEEVVDLVFEALRRWRTLRND